MRRFLKKEFILFYTLLLVFIPVILITIYLTRSVLSANATYVLQTGQQGPIAEGPRDIAIDSSGNIYAFTDQNRVLKFDSSGTLVTEWGSNGSGNGQFDGDNAIGIDSSDNVYVADTNNHRIQKFTSSGVYVSQFGTEGSGDGQFESPKDVAIDSFGNIYVADQLNNRIQKFDSSGTFVAKWGANGGDGTSGTGDGEFDQPGNIAIDSSDNIYVIDFQNNRIQKFDTSGAFITKWGIFGSGDGQFDFPSGINIDSSGNVYVTDTFRHRIQKFDSAGAFITKWGMQGSGNGQLSYPQGVATDSTGNVYVGDWGNARIQEFDSSGTYLSQFAVIGNGNGEFSGPWGIAVDSSSNFYVVDQSNDRIEKFDSSGAYVTQWGTFGTNNGEFDTPYGIAVDSSNNVYVADEYNHRIQKFDSNGGYITQWGIEGSGDGEFEYPNDVYVDSSNNVYVADFNNDRIQKFSNTGTYISQFGTSGSGDGEFSAPSGVVTDSLGNVYVLDQGNDRIEKFDSSGTYVTQWGTNGSGNGEFSLDYSGLGIDSSDHIYVPDSYNDRVQVFDSSGAYIFQFGTSGSGNGEFTFPEDVAIDSSGNAYVTDYNNDRVQKFSVDFTPPSPYLPTTPGPFENGIAYVYGRSIGTSATDTDVVIPTNTVDASDNFYYSGNLDCSSGPTPSNVIDFDPSAGGIDNKSYPCQGYFFTKINSDASYGYTYIGTSSASVTRIKADSSGNIYILGQFTGSGNFDITGGIDNKTANGAGSDFLTKINSNGTYGYTYVWPDGPTSALDLTTDSSSNVYIGGYIVNSGGSPITYNLDPTGGTDNQTVAAGSNRAYYLKINSNGTYASSKSIQGNVVFQRLAIDSNNNLYLSGAFSGTQDFDPTVGTDNKTSNGNTDTYLSKFDSSGNYVYTYTIGGTGDDASYTVGIDHNNNVFLVGYVHSTSIDFDPTAGTDTRTPSAGYHTFLTKINSDATYAYSVVWKSLLASSNDGTESIAFDSTNKVYLITAGWYSATNFDPIGTDNFNSNIDSSALTLLENSDGTYDHTFIWSDLNNNDYIYLLDAAFNSINFLHIVGWRYANSVDYDPTSGTDIVGLQGDQDGVVLELAAPEAAPTDTPTPTPTATPTPTPTLTPTPTATPTPTLTPTPTPTGGPTPTPTGGPTPTNTPTPTATPTPTPVPGTANITGTVFVDTNGNGIQDNGEVGYPGATLDLSGSGTSSTTSGSLGEYSFPDNPPGDYTITLNVPGGYMTTTTNPVSITNLTSDTEVDFGIQVGPTPTAPPPGSNPPVCTDTKPGLPSNLVATNGPGSGQITLTWTGASVPVTDYSITYSDDINTQKYGVISTGNVTTYVISNLNPNVKYYFWLNAINGCASGDQIGPVFVGGPTATPADVPILPPTGPGTLISLGGIGLFLLAVGAILLLAL